MRMKGTARYDYPIVRELLRDWRVKERLEKDFKGLYAALTKAIKANPKLKRLHVPLEKVKDDVHAASFGPFFGLIGPIARPRKPSKR